MSSEHSWWQTLPGVLTATAGVLSAVTALVVALNQTGLFKKEAAPASQETIKTASADAKPAAKSEQQTAARVPPSSVTEAERRIEQEPTAAISTTPSANEAARPLGALDDKALLAELKRANVGYSVNERTMLDWLDDEDKTFRRVARASARLLNGERVRGNAPDLDVIKYHYLQRATGDGGGVLAADSRIDDNQLRQAIVAAFNDKNGTTARRFEGILEH